MNLKKKSKMRKTKMKKISLIILIINIIVFFEINAQDTTFYSCCPDRVLRLKYEEGSFIPDSTEMNLYVLSQYVQEIKKRYNKKWKVNVFISHCFEEGNTEFDIVEARFRWLVFFIYKETNYPIYLFYKKGEGIMLPKQNCHAYSRLSFIVE